MEKNFETLEVDCWYKTRAGALVQIIEYRHYNDDYPFWANSDDTYTRDGNIFKGGEKSMNDLVQKISTPVYE
jgi:hypothetical protein